MSFKLSALVAGIAAVLALTATRPVAHEGHDHAAAAPIISTATPRLEANSDKLELVAIKRGEELEIWLDRFATNEPVTTATIEVETPAGPVKAVAASDGSYRLGAAWAAKAGAFELAFTVTEKTGIEILPATLVVPPESPAKVQSLPAAGAPSLWAGGAVLVALLGGLAAVVVLRRRSRSAALALAIALCLITLLSAAQLVAHEGDDHGTAKVLPLSTDRSQILADGSVFAPKPTQRILGVRTMIGLEEQYKKRVELPGRIVPDPNSSGLVQASTTGRLSPPAAGFPRLGAKVKAGDVLAYVTAPFAAIDQSTMRQQAGDLDQQITIVERRLARNETLAKTGSIAKATLDETRLELQGLVARRASLEKVKREPEALRAPVDGVVAAANAVAGQVADTNTTVFQIVDPSKFLIEALAFEAPAADLLASGRMANGRSLVLDYLGTGIADRNQAVPVHFAIRDPAGLRLGQFASVFAETSEAVSGLAVPRASIVRRANGESIVYEHIGAERFEAVSVRTVPLDADRVLIVSGLTAGHRIVTQATELLNQVR